MSQYFNYTTYMRWICICTVLLAAFAIITLSKLNEPQAYEKNLCNTESTVQFSDINDHDDYASDYILCVKALRLAKGGADGTYRGDENLTRAQMASFLVRLWRDVLRRSCPQTPEHSFTDITDRTHKTNIACLYALGIIQGVNDTSYVPSGNLTTAQLTRLVARMAQQSQTSFMPASGGQRTPESRIMPHRFQHSTELCRGRIHQTRIASPDGRIPDRRMASCHEPRPPAQAPRKAYTSSSDHYHYHHDYHHNHNTRTPSQAFGWLQCRVRRRRTFMRGVKVNGSITCWGDNSHGQAGAPTGEFNTVSAGGGGHSASAGGGHSCGIKVNGSITCWGDNSYKQTNAPTGEFNTVSAGGGHSCGIKINGSITCLGRQQS